MKNTRNVLYFAAALSTLPMSAALAGTFTYQLTEIAPFNSDDYNSYGFALNDNGTVVATSFDSYTRHQYTWKDGVVTEVNSISLLNDVSYAGINNQEAVAISTVDENGVYTAVTITDGTVTELAKPSGTAQHTYAHAINNIGQVVGSDNTGAALVWEEGSVTQLAEFADAPNGNYLPLAINDASQIVGSVDLEGVFGEPTAVMWENGQIKDLSTDPIITGVSMANDINNLGQVVGYAETADGIHAALWQDGAATIIGAPTLNAGLDFLPASNAQAINDMGQVVGIGQEAFGSFGFIWDLEDGFRQLADLIDPSLGWVLETALDINNQGQILGRGINANGEVSAFLLTPELAVAPVPLPAGLPLMIGGMISLVALRRRQKKTAA